LGLILLCIVTAAVALKFTGGRHVDRGVIAQGDVLAIGTQLKLYRDLNGSFPTTEQGLDALVTRPTFSPVPEHWRQLVYSHSLYDPWHRKLQYRQQDADSFDLFSLGPDGVESSDDIRVAH
jgi:general secretion pathway protein G